MFIAIIFTISSGNTPVQQNMTHIKKEKIVSFATTWMQLERIC